MASSVRAYIAENGFRGTLAKSWSSSVSLGLKCDLGALPARRPAKVPLQMVRAFSAREAGLTAEVERDSANTNAAKRVALCAAGVERLFVARDPEGKPCYVQWLVGPDEHGALDRIHPGLFPKPEPGQVLLEGAYTLTDARGIGAMADGMRQLLEIARDEGASEAITYVASDYPPAIRGCQKAGFELDCVRISSRRILRRSHAFGAPDAAALEAWTHAVG